MNDDTFFSLDEAWDQGLKQKTEAMLEEKSGQLRALGILDQMDAAAQELGVSQIDKTKIAEYMWDTKTFDPKQAVSEVYPANTPLQNDEPISRENLGNRIGESLGGQRIESQSAQSRNDGEETFVEAMKRRMGVA